MKRQRIRNAEYREFLDQNIDDDYDYRDIQMHRQRKPRHENVLEAQIQPGDTLQAIALRYNCTISDLKRLNKIEKEIEIHARKTLKVPINAHTILLSTNSEEFPIVHKSGQNSPKHSGNQISASSSNGETHSQISNTINSLDEKLLVASVSLASSKANPIDSSPTNNDVHRIHRYDRGRSRNVQEDQDDEESVFTDPLLRSDMENNDELTTLRSGPHAIRGAPRNDFSCSGSDCDISWICLLVLILALCFAIPLFYIIYIAEHPEKFNHKESD